MLLYAWLKRPGNNLSLNNFYFFVMEKPDLLIASLKCKIIPEDMYKFQFLEENLKKK